MKCSFHYILDLEDFKSRSGLFTMPLGGIFTSTAVFSGRFGGSVNQKHFQKDILEELSEFGLYLASAPH